MQLAPVALAALAYALRARTLRRRGTPLPAWRMLLFGLGITLLVLAFASPIAAIGEQELFSFHMLQHVLIGDLAPLCLLAGLSGPLLLDDIPNFYGLHAWLRGEGSWQSVVFTNASGPMGRPVSSASRRS